MIIYDPIIINKTISTLKWYYKNGNNDEYKNIKYSNYRKIININETLIDILVDAKYKQIICVMNYLNERRNGSKIVLVPLGKARSEKIEFANVEDAYNSYENPIKIVRKSKKLLFFNSQFNTVTAEIKRIVNEAECDFFAQIEIEQNAMKGVNNKHGDNEKQKVEENNKCINMKENEVDEENNFDS